MALGAQVPILAGTLACTATLAGRSSPAHGDGRDGSLDGAGRAGGAPCRTTWCRCYLPPLPRSKRVLGQTEYPFRGHRMRNRPQSAKCRTRVEGCVSCRTKPARRQGPPSSPSSTFIPSQNMARPLRRFPSRTQSRLSGQRSKEEQSSGARRTGRRLSAQIRKSHPFVLLTNTGFQAGGGSDVLSRTVRSSSTSERGQFRAFFICLPRHRPLLPTPGNRSSCRLAEVIGASKHVN